MKKLVVAIVTAFVLWFLMFSPLTAGYVNFWLAMSLSAVVLTAMAMAMRGRLIVRGMRFSWRDLAIGVGSAAVLWGVFWLGNFLSVRMFDFAQGQVANVYAMKTGENQLIIGMLLLFVIGPAEEIFWHGLVQSELTKKIASPCVIIVTTLIYSLVHLPSLNFMLIMAAFVCGLFWSAIYYYNRNLLTVLVSHALWDVSVFVLFPIS